MRTLILLLILWYVHCSKKRKLRGGNMGKGREVEDGENCKVWGKERNAGIAAYVENKNETWGGRKLL